MSAQSGGTFDAVADRMRSGFGVPNLIRGLSFVSLGAATRASGALPTLLLPSISIDASSSVATDAAVAHGSAVQYCISTSVAPSQCLTGAVGGGCIPLSLTLVWTDPPGSPASLYALVNDLDLVVITPAGKLLRGNNDENETMVREDTATARV